MVKSSKKIAYKEMQQRLSKLAPASPTLVHVPLSTSHVPVNGMHPASTTLQSTMRSLAIVQELTSSRERGID